MRADPHVCAVVTAPFKMDSPNPVERTLSLLSGQRLAQVLVLCDRKGNAGPQVERAVESYGPKLAEDGIDIRVESVDAQETARRWRIGLVRAFYRHGADAVLLLPGDVERALESALREGVSRMVSRAAVDRLVVGDYTTKEVFKSKFDELVTLPLIAHEGGAALRFVSGLGLTKLRSEFLVVGRQVLECFEAREGLWGTDPTPQLLLTAHAAKLDVEVVDLGPFEDDARTRQPAGMAYQITRIGGQFAIDAAVSKVREGPYPSARQEWEAANCTLLKVRGIFETTQRAIGANQAALQRSEPTAPDSPRASERHGYRAAFLVLEEQDWAHRVKALWNGTLPDEDPLNALSMVIGEALAWGPSPHITLTDALTTSCGEAFEAAVEQASVGMTAEPLIPGNLELLQANALVVPWKSHAFDAFRQELQRVTVSFVVRASITDEEWQRAEWWIDLAKRGADDNRAALRRARERYEAAGSPGLPASRHFRLGRLVALSRALDRRPDSADAAGNLESFLLTGSPPWYGRGAPLHTTIASGLAPEAGEARIASHGFGIDGALKPWTPAYVAIMSEDPETRVSVRFFDPLTEAYVRESRPGFRVLRRIPLGPKG